MNEQDPQLDRSSESDDLELTEEQSELIAGGASQKPPRSKKPSPLLTYDASGKDLFGGPGEFLPPPYK